MAEEGGSGRGGSEELATLRGCVRKEWYLCTILRLLPLVDEGSIVVFVVVIAAAVVVVEEGVIRVEVFVDTIGRPVRRLLLPLLPAPTVAGTGFTTGRLTDCLGGIPVAMYSRTLFEPSVCGGGEGGVG